MTDNRNAIDTALVKLSTACHYLELTRPSKKDVKCASEAAKDASDILKASLVLLDHDCYTVQEPPQAPGTPLFDPKGQPTPAAAQDGKEPEPERAPVGEFGCAVIDVEAVDPEPLPLEPFPAGKKTEQKAVFAQRLTTLEDMFVDHQEAAGSQDFNESLKAFRPHRDAWKAAWKENPETAWQKLQEALRDAQATKLGETFTAWAPAA